VRKLAERSQVSAVEIEALTKNSVRATEEAGKLLSGIAPEIGKTARLVQEIAAASIEQNSGANQVNNAIQQLNQITQQNAAASEEMATSSEELASQAQQLLEMISYFKLAKEEKTKTFGSERLKINKPMNYVKPNEKSSFQNSDQQNKFKSGFTINMGKDHLDSGYERF
jgi:methyl-accepting chemotaxis protein